MRFFIKTSIIATASICVLSACTMTNPSRRSGVILPSFNITQNNVDPDMANACIVSAANKYYLPTRVIHAVDSRTQNDGSNVVILKVDVRDAQCVIGANGVVRSVVDTSPKSADQLEAEAKAAKDAAAKAAVKTATKPAG